MTLTKAERQQRWRERSRGDRPLPPVCQCGARVYKSRLDIDGNTVQICWKCWRQSPAGIKHAAECQKARDIIREQRQKSQNLSETLIEQL